MGNSLRNSENTQILTSGSLIIFRVISLFQADIYIEEYLPFKEEFIAMLLWAVQLCGHWVAREITDFLKFWEKTRPLAGGASPAATHPRAPSCNPLLLGPVKTPPATASPPLLITPLLSTEEDSRGQSHLSHQVCSAVVCGHSSVSGVYLGATPQNHITHCQSPTIIPTQVL